MIISKEELTEMGFDCSDENEARVESCIKRAEAMLNALCGGTLYSAARNEYSADYVKQAVAFQTDALLHGTGSAPERVSVGDFSYTSDKESSIETSDTVKRLLKAAGCFYGAAVTEVSQ